MDSKKLLNDIIMIIDGAKETYKEDQYMNGQFYAAKGEEKWEMDSCCNESLNYVISTIKERYGDLLDS